MIHLGNVEVHSIDTRHECQWDENDRDDCEDLHDFVHPVTQAGQIDVKHTSDGLSICFHKICDPDDVVVEVSKVNLCVLANQCGLITVQSEDYLSQRPAMLNSRCWKKSSKKSKIISNR